MKTNPPGYKPANEHQAQRSKSNQIRNPFAATQHEPHAEAKFRQVKNTKAKIPNRTAAIDSRRGLA